MLHFCLWQLFNAQLNMVQHIVAKWHESIHRYIYLDVHLLLFINFTCNTAFVTVITNAFSAPRRCWWMALWWWQYRCCRCRWLSYRLRMLCVYERKYAIVIDVVASPICKRVQITSEFDFSTTKTKKRGVCAANIQAFIKLSKFS